MVSQCEQRSKKHRIEGFSNEALKQNMAARTHRGLLASVTQDMPQARAEGQELRLWTNTHLTKNSWLKMLCLQDFLFFSSCWCQRCIHLHFGTRGANFPDTAWRKVTANRNKCGMDNSVSSKTELLVSTSAFITPFQRSHSRVGVSLGALTSYL